MKFWIGITIVVVLFAGGTIWRAQSGKTNLVSVTVPALSASAKAGEALFNQSCAVCHGTNAAGSRRGPSLILQIYQPGHHGDAAFLSAIRLGVRRHHWRFGNMPRRPEIDEQGEKDIITYIRELQRANGIR